MNTPREDSYCRKCSAKNSLLNGLCCKCGYHSEEDREGTLTEKKDAIAQMDAAIADMKKFLRQ